MEELFNVVQELGLHCPWTKSLTSRSMLKWLQSELIELEQELSKLEDIQRGSSLNNEKCLEHCRDRVTSELGDVLFDTLMVEMMIRR